MIADIEALQKTAAFHIRRGDAMQMDPVTVLELANSLRLAINSLRSVQALPHNDEAKKLATESLKFLGVD